MLQIDQLIACLQLSVNQQGLLADKKCEGRCSGDYFLSYSFVKKIPLGRHVGYVMDRSMGQ